MLLDRAPRLCIQMGGEGMSEERVNEKTSRPINGGERRDGFITYR
jgi:hypothetical protein